MSSGFTSTPSCSQVAPTRTPSNVDRGALLADERPGDARGGLQVEQDFLFAAGELDQLVCRPVPIVERPRAVRKYCPGASPLMSPRPFASIGTGRVTSGMHPHERHLQSGQRLSDGHHANGQHVV